jgi:NTP pyrophosphatase (non-canonical NTP hydrolase)
MNIYKELLTKYGTDSQLNQAQEELAELIQAISKFKRYGDLMPLIEELVDVEIMMSQLKEIIIQSGKIDKYAEITSRKIVGLSKLL